MRSSPTFLPHALHIAILLHRILQYSVGYSRMFRCARLCNLLIVHFVGSGAIYPITHLIYAHYTVFPPNMCCSASFASIVMHGTAIDHTQPSHLRHHSRCICLCGTNRIPTQTAVRNAIPCSLCANLTTSAVVLTTSVVVLTTSVVKGKLFE